MALTSVHVGLKVALPATAADWQLYELPGAEMAAQALTKALKAALADADGGTPAARYATYIAPVASYFLAFGATDTEPRDIALTILSTLVGGTLSASLFGTGPFGHGRF